VPQQAPEQDTPAHEAWCKLRAAYGAEVDWTSAHSLLAAPSALDAHGYGGGGDSSIGARKRIQLRLGTSMSVHASSGAQLCDLYSKCVDSVNDASEGSLWPIVKRVVLRYLACVCVFVCLCLCVCV